jgi:hypothetical protein
MEKVKNSKLKFEYIDQYGNKTKLVKEFNANLIEETDGVLNYIINRFQDFLLSSEFQEEMVKSIDYER